MQPYYKGEEGIEEGTFVSHLVLLINQAKTRGRKGSIVFVV